MPHFLENNNLENASPAMIEILWSISRGGDFSTFRKFGLEQAQVSLLLSRALNCDFIHLVDDRLELTEVGQKALENGIRMRNSKFLRGEWIDPLEDAVIEQSSALDIYLPSRKTVRKL